MNLYRIKLLEDKIFTSAEYYVIARSKTLAIKIIKKEVVDDFVKIGSVKLLSNKVLKGSVLLKNPYLKEEKGYSELLTGTPAMLKKVEMKIEKAKKYRGW